MKKLFSSTSSKPKPPVPNLRVTKVSLSGSLLTSIVQEATSFPEDEDMEGFLFGRRIHHTKQVTTDFEDRREVVETEISFQSYISAGDRGTFYDDKGKVDPEKMDAITQAQWLTEQENVGWLVVRKNTGDWPSLRDAAVHNSLSHIAGPDCPWLLLLVNIDSLQNKSTQGLTYRCLQHSCETPLRGRFDPVPVGIKNADYNAHSEYTNFSPFGEVLSTLEAPGTAEIMNDMNSLYSSYPPLHVQEQEAMFDAVMERIDGLVQEVKDKEKDLYRLREEKRILESLVS